MKVGDRRQVEGGRRVRGRKNGRPGQRPRRPLEGWAKLTRRLRRASPILLLSLAALPAGLAAQGGEWPTLSAMGIEYLSPSGAFQVSLSGQLDLEALYVSNAWGGLTSVEGGADLLKGSPEDCSACHTEVPFGSTEGGLAPHRLRIFTNVFLGDHFFSLVELRSDRGEAASDGRVRARVEQAYLRVANREGSWGVQTGRFASPVGAYPLRHLSVVDPFLRPPLGYDFRTLMNRTVVPADEAGLLEWRHSPEDFRRPGAPPVWDVPYQWGALAFGHLLGTDVRVAAVNSAPSSAPDAWAFDVDRLRDPSWVVALRRRLSIDWEVGLSWNRGPWMEAPTSGVIRPRPGDGAGAPAPSYKDFDQEILTADVTFARGATMLHAEAMLDRWGVPNIADRPTEVIYDVELQRDLAAGLFAAGRVGHIDFRGLGGGEDWDRDVTRYEASLGYRITKNAGVLLSAYEQVQSQASDADARFAGLRLWWAF